MSTTTNLTDAVTAANSHGGSWKDVPLTQDIKMFLWEQYDPHDDLIYPNIKEWDALLEKTVSSGNYDILSKDDVLSILFGLIHRTRIVDGLWVSTFERGVTQKLLERLLVLDAK